MEIKQLKLNGENIYPKVAIDSIVGEDGSSKVDTTVTENSDNLITSGAVYEAIQSGTGHSVAWENVTGKPEFANVATSGDYNDLIGKPSFKTVNNESVTGTGNIAVQSVLVSGTNIKTINGNSLLGEGNIEILGGSTITVDDHLDANSTNPVQNKVINGVVGGLNQNISGKVSSVKVGSTTYNPTSGVVSLPAYPIGDVTKVSYSNNAGDFTPDQNGVVTLTIDQSLNEDSGRPVTNAAVAIALNEAEETMNGIGALANANANDLTNVHTDINAINNLITSLASDKQETLVSGTNIKTINNQSILGSGNIDISGGTITVDSQFSNTSENPVLNKVISSEISSISSDLTGLHNSLSGKQNTLVSGTNIKTINNQSILGSGNITISGGGTGRQCLSFISGDGSLDTPELYSLAIPFTDDAFTIRVTAVDCTSSGDRFSTKTNVYTVFAKRYSDYAMRVVNRDGDNSDMIKTAKSLANTTVTYEGLSSSSSDIWFLPIQVTSSSGLKVVIMEIIGATINGSQASVSCYPGSLTYPNSQWRNDELNNLMA